MSQHYVAGVCEKVANSQRGVLGGWKAYTLPRDILRNHFLDFFLKCFCLVQQWLFVDGVVDFFHFLQLFFKCTKVPIFSHTLPPTLIWDRLLRLLCSVWHLVSAMEAYYCGWRGRHLCKKRTVPPVNPSSRTQTQEYFFIVKFFERSEEKFKRER